MFLKFRSGIRIFCVKCLGVYGGFWENCCWLCDEEWEVDFGDSF